ncbi:MAG: hypothetical protein C0506_09320 [Anaerolinea sp.]|nr:hypothetical protein [Anaerolinea sp.]
MVLPGATPSPEPVQLEPLPQPGARVSMGTPGKTTSGVFLLDYAGLGIPGALYPLDGRTGAGLAGFKPIEVGHAARFYPAPTGNLIAARSTAGIYLLDARDWSVTFVTYESVSDWWSPFWSPDSRFLFNISREAENQNLERIDVATGSKDTVASLGDWWPVAARFHPDGRTLFVLGMNSSDPRTNLLDGDPFLVALDPFTGAENGRVVLPGLVVGQRRESNAGRTWYGQYFTDIAVSLDGRRVFVPHPESESVTVIDAKSMTRERTIELAATKRPWRRALDGMTGWFVTRAVAKGGPVSRVQAQLSPDGRFLYVAGARDVGCDGPPSCEEGRPLGLRVIDTESLKVVHREPGISSFVVSPDGRTLAGWAGGWWGPEATPNGDYVRHGDGVKVVDAREPRVRLHLLPGEPVQTAAIAPNGNVLVAIPGPGLASAMRNQGKCAEACYYLRLFEPARGELTGERLLYSGIFELFTQGD